MVSGSMDSQAGEREIEFSAVKLTGTGSEVYTGGQCF